MNHLISRFLFAVIVSFSCVSCGCLDIFISPPKMPDPLALPLEHIRRIAICPVAIQPKKDAHGYDIALDQSALGRLIAEEFNKFQNKEGFQIIWPREVVAKMIEKNINLNHKEDVIQLGNLLQVDAICLIQINQWAGFTPKRCTLNFFLYQTKTDADIIHRIVNISDYGQKFGSGDEDEISEKKGQGIAMIQRQWDAGTLKTINYAKAWANRDGEKHDARWQRILNINNEFFRMIFHFTIRDYIDQLSQLYETKAKPGKHAPKARFEVEMSRRGVH